MIPGPVAGHVPIDPGAAQRQPGDAAGETGADSGTSFADLLAAMLAPGAAGAQLPRPASNPPEAVLERLDAAEIFNETGLFRGAAPQPSEGAFHPAGSVSSPIAAVAPGAGVTAVPGSKGELRAATAPLGAEAPDVDVPAVPAGPASAEGDGAPVSAAPAGAASRTGHGAVPLLRAQAVAPSGSPPESAPGGAEPAGGARVPSRTAALVAQLLAARAGSAAAQVSIQAAEGGISVMARVDKLSREERDRLRGEIGELLARHGFGSAQIVLNGEAWPLPQGEED
jgi:hypothetical protein